MTPAQFKRIRKKLRLHQDELAEVLDIASDRTLRRWEAGQQDIPGPVMLLMELMAEVPEVREYLDLDWIDGGEEKNHGGHYDD